MRTIWCLFSVDNNYDQPPNNLVAWWALKPGIWDLHTVIQGLEGSVALDVVASIHKGGERRVDNTDYRLAVLREGKLP